MFVHRTTFIRRLERIREISGIDLDREDNILHLLLSYKILAIQEH
jgi:DNA-binding PucR family transcriptional regulator